MPWGYSIANALVFKKVRAALGLDRCKVCFTGAAPITKDTLDYFMSLNMPILELYGMSESSGPHTVSCNEQYRITRSADHSRCVTHFAVNGSLDRNHGSALLPS